jgi:hypothetical protein
MTTVHPSSQRCASRSDAGLAHVECRVEVAERQMASSDGWWECGTCKQAFTGAMQLGLADAWWLVEMCTACPKRTNSV